MNVLEIPRHEPLPPHTSLREIAERANTKRKSRVALKLHTVKAQLQPEPAVEFASTAEVSLCVGCKTKLRHAGHDYDAQIWGCVTCGRARNWGNSQPSDRAIRPVLNCAHCEAPTRHAFVGVIGKTL